MDAASVIRKARLRAHMTQEQLADALGVPQSFVAKIEIGARTVRVHEFIAIARVLAGDPVLLFRELL